MRKRFSIYTKKNSIHKFVFRIKGQGPGYVSFDVMMHTCADTISQQMTFNKHMVKYFAAKKIKKYNNTFGLRVTFIIFRQTLL